MITAVILTKNNEHTLAKTLDSLQFLSEVLIVDTGSKDQTLSLAKKYPNVKTIKEKLYSFGLLRNQAADLAKNPWILSIDSDEELSPTLQRSIQNLTLDPNTVYGVIRENRYKEKTVVCCGWKLEKRLRLYERSKTKFSTRSVHESLEINGLQSTYLPGKLYHTPFFSERDFITKMQLYTELYAKEHAGKPSSIKKACLHGLWAFIRAYFLQKGIFYGESGWRIALYQALSSYYKYSKLAEYTKEAQQKNRPPKA